jgi:Dolichyl-phosphate-mannose-protein mannosyltransferase
VTIEASRPITIESTAPRIITLPPAIPWQAGPPKVADPAPDTAVSETATLAGTATQPRPSRTRAAQPRIGNHRGPSTIDRAVARALTSQSIWLLPLLIVQAWFCFRLSNTFDQDEAMSVNAGHQLIAHLLHGTPVPAFGSYFSGVPSAYAVPAAMVDALGGAGLVHAASTAMVMLTTVAVYLVTRRLFGQSAALVAAGVFAVDPAAVFIGRYASFDAPALLLLALALCLAVKAADRWLYAVAIGPVLVLACAEKYLVLALVPGVLLLTAIVGVQEFGRRRGLRAAALATAATLAAAGLLAVTLTSADWHGLMFTSLDRVTQMPESRAALLRQCLRYGGGLTAAGLAGVIVLRERWRLPVVLLAMSAVPALAQLRFNEGTSLERNMAFGLLFLAPLVGVAGAHLLRRGRVLAARAAAALAALVLLLSSGMGTSAAMVNGWPNSAQIDMILAHYVHAGPQRYLADGSQIPAYYLSRSTSYGQWQTTSAPRYDGLRGARLLARELERRTFALFLYRDEGPTIGLDHDMLPILKRGYILVAKVPISPNDPHQFWYLWQAPQRP